ncbi:MAG: InlB B-repeat-containing protein [Lachnospiraceae bacterium]|nr:InlB B-repeat-containing protein [Lachnospiraceae bacterium]
MKFFYKNDVCKRVISMFMAFLMFFTMFAAQLPNGILEVQAAEGDMNITVHFDKNVYTGWTTPAIQFWGGELTPSNYVGEPAEIEGWNGAIGYTLTDEGNGWYSITLTGSCEGFQFLDMANPGNNTGGKGYHVYLAQYTDAEPKDLYFRPYEDNYNGKWYTDAECTVELAAPEGAITYDATIHWYNIDEWATVYAYAWDAAGTPLAGEWPGTVATANQEKDGWYDISLEDLTGDTLKIIFNNGNGGTGNQTSDLITTLTAETTELWVIGGVNSPQLVTESPEAWTGTGSGEGSEDDSEDDTGSGDIPTIVNPEINGKNVTFRYYAPEAEAVCIAGTINGWNMTANPMTKGEDSVFELTLELEPGRYEYKFVIDGEWEDCDNRTFEIVDDSAPEVVNPEINGTKVTFRYYAPNANSVHVSGTMNGWNTAADPMTKGENGVFELTLTLLPGSYEYKFVIDGQYEDGGNRTFEVVDDGEVDTPNSIYCVTDVMEVKIGDDIYPMNVYVNGVFEANMTLPAGTYTATLVQNGDVTDKTAELTLVAEKAVYFRLNGEKFEAAEVAPAALVGSLSALDSKYSDWDPASAVTELTYLGGGLYQGTFAFEALAADTAIEYKVAFNDGWDWAIGNNGGNISVTVPANAKTFTVLADAVNNVIYDDVRTADFSVNGSGKAPFTTTISLIGTVRESGGDDWSTGVQGYEFTPISDTLYRFEKTFKTAGTYTYKVVFDYATWYDKEGDQTLKIAENNTKVVFLYDTETGYVLDTLNEDTRVASLLSMKVKPAQMEVVTNDNGTVTFVATAKAGQTVALFYGKKAEVEVNGEGALKKAEMSAVTNGKSTSGELWLGDDALDLVYYYEIDGARTLDGSRPSVTIGEAEYSNYKRDAYTGRTINVPGTLPGPSWDAASNVMTYTGNRIYTYTFKDVPAAKYEYKIAVDGSWAENYGKNGVPGGDNISVAVPEKQDVTIYYSDVTHYAVNSIDYIFATITLTGTKVPEGTMLTDEGLTGIYSATVTLPAGTYSDFVITCEGEPQEVAEFTLEEEKAVTFCMDPVMGIFYHNASDVAIKEDLIYFDSKDAEYKSVFGAVATGEEVTFSLTTGNDITYAKLLVKGSENKIVDMTAEQGAEVTLKWSATVSLNTIGEYEYYFVVSNGSSVKVYGDDDGYYGVGKVDELTTVQPYDLVVYRSDFETPDWMKNAVIYQIFPDRFFDADSSNNQAQTSARGSVDYEYITNWYTLPENPEQKEMLDEATYKATGAHYGDGEWSNEIYGGDLKGITENIDYLKALGVTVIYLNPVFASISNHRYDACDYMQIDPVLGTEGDFAELVKIAEKNGMKVVLDGVFNHVSDDSIYFDRYYKFLALNTDEDEANDLATVGAYPYWAYVYDYMTEKAVTQEVAEQAAKAYFTETYGITDYSYVEWFEVFKSPMGDGKVYDKIGLRTDKPVYGYDGWWGYDSMPIIKSTNGSEYQTGNWAEKIIGNAEGTSVTQYWISEGMDGWRLDVANEVSDETWQRFRESVKALNNGEAVIIGEIWDDATKYILGDMYDSVMNYMFRNVVTAFAMGTDAEKTTLEMERLRERYPEEAFYAMMNLVGSHDTTRILSYLDGIGDDRADKSIDAAFPTYEKTSQTAKERQHLVAFLQFTYAGAPTIYYGDEIGMVGSDDPDDRRAFEWGKGQKELVEYYATLAAVRSKYSALRTGSVETFETGSANVLGYVRRDNKNQVIVLANNSSEAVEITLDLADLNVNADKLVNVLDKTKTVVKSKVATVSVPAYRGLILVDDNKVVNVTVNKNALAPAYDASYEVDDREYRIVYHVSGGVNSELNVKTYIAGGVDNNTIKLADPTAKAGYRFAGWYLDADYKQPFAGITTETVGDVHVYAKWIPYTYQVVLADGDGKEVAQTYTYGVSQALKNNTYKKTGYVFIGWAKTQDATEPLFTNKQVVNDTILGITAQSDNELKVTLYPVWKNTYNVTYDLQGGNMEDATTTTYTYKTGIAKLPAPTREGYTFSGWYRDLTFKKKVASITKSMAEDLVLYAKWTPCKYTINFNANAAAFDAKTKATGTTKAMSMQYDKAATLNANKYVLKGYKFVGWSLVEGVAGESDVIFTDAQSVMNLTSTKNGKVTLYAQWEKTVYGISYYTNGGMLPADAIFTYEYNHEGGYTLPTPTKEGYTFAGWYKDPALKKAVAKNSAKQNILKKTDFGDITLYAKWTAPYTVVFDKVDEAATGTTKNQSLKVEAMTALKANGYKKTNYAFMGWAVEPNGTVVFANKQKVNGAAVEAYLKPATTEGVTTGLELKLYAVWANAFTVTFDAKDGAFADGAGTVSMGYVYKAGLAQLPADPVRDGYTFKGWYRDEKCKKALAINSKNGSCLTAASDFGDITLYAKWVGDKYDVTFDADADGVKGKTATQKNRVYGTEKALAANGYKRTGYAFLGWSLTPVSEATLAELADPSLRVDYVNKEKVDIFGAYAKNVTLYAVWERLEYSITYKNVEEAEVEGFVTSYSVEDKVALEEPERLGYTFMGWYTDKNCKKKATDIKVGTTGDKVYYAKWVLNKETTQK